MSSFTYIPFKAKFTQFRKKTRISVKSILPKYSYILIKHMRTNSLRIKEECSLLTISDLYYKYKLVPLKMARKLEYSLESNELGSWPPPSWARQLPRRSFQCSMIHTLRKLGRMDYLDLKFIAASNMNTFFQSSNLRDFLFIPTRYIILI